MKTTLAPRPSFAPHLIREHLERLQRRLRRIEILAGAAKGLCFALLILFTFAAFDLVLELPTGIRAACGLLAVALMAVFIVRAAMLAARESGPLQLARRIDPLTAGHGQVATGVDLLLNPIESASPASAGMSEIAIERASILLARISDRAAIPSQQFRNPAAIFVTLIAILALLAWIFPRPLFTQFTRFFDPFGDHPPYSWLTFAADPGNASVIYGSGLDVRVTTSALTDHVDLVLRDGDHEDTIPMFAEPDNHWKASITRILKPGQYFIRSGRARSQHFSLSVITIPKISAVTYHITYPTYTRKPPYDGPLPAGGLAGLPGTQIEIRAKSNRPLSGGTLDFLSSSPTQNSALGTQNSADEVAGVLTLRSPGKIRLTVTDIANQTSAEAYEAQVALLADERPFVRITDPKQDSFATPDARLDIVTLAEDDYGLSRLQLFRSQNRSASTVTDIVLPAPPPTRFTSTLPLAISQLAVKPGDEIKLFARAQDNDPAAAKGSESPVVTLHIISQSQLDQMLLRRDGIEAMQSEYAEAERRMEMLNREIEQLEKDLRKSDPASALADEQRKPLAKLAADMNQAADEIEKFAGHNLPIDLDIQMRQQLSDLANIVRKSVEHATAASTQPNLGVAGALDKLADIQNQLGSGKSKYEQAVIAPLEHLVKILPLLQDQARYLDLYHQQKDLAERMASLKDRENPNDPQTRDRLHELEEEQQANRNELQKLTSDILDHVAALPEDHRLDDLRHMATDFAMSVQSSDADAQMQAAESSLADSSGSAAHANAQAAADTLEQFITKCEAAGNQAGTCLKFQPELAAGLGNSVDQLLSAMSASTGGTMSGSSAARASLANVGLYGNIPLRSAESGSHGGHAQHGIGANDAGEKVAGPPAPFASRGALEARGQSSATVPPQYQRRVGEYFRRVSDELGQ